MDDITLTTITPIGNITNILHLIILQPMHFFPMAMYTHTLVPPPKEVSTELGETRSAKRGAVSVDILEETDGLGGLKDR